MRLKEPTALKLCPVVAGLELVLPTNGVTFPLV